jgi:dephospho-CoA kinase
MPIVALTGGIAAGKSTVTAVLEELGALVVDADALARQAVEPGSRGLSAIVSRFGEGILDPSGSLNRAALGEIVFSDAQARVDLERIVHPIVGDLSKAAFSRASAEQPGRVLIYAIPLLAESARQSEFDLVVVVHAPSQERVRRLVELRGLSESEASARVQSQATDAERLALADIVIDAGGTQEQTLARAHALYSVLQKCWPDRLSEAPGLYTTLQP